MKTKYEGRTIEELMKAQRGTWTGEEEIFFEANKKGSKQSSLVNFAVGAKERVMGNITEFARKTAHIGAEARARAEKEAEIEDIMEETKKVLRREYGLDDEE